MQAVWKMLLVYVAMDVYARLYLHTINQQMPSLQPHVWLPIISPYSQHPAAPGKLADRCFVVRHCMACLLSTSLRLPT